MIHAVGRPLFALALSTAFFPAAAQDRPPAMPTRDVVVTYKVDPAPPNTDTVAWLVSEGRIRTEGRALTQRVAHLIDMRSGGVTAVLDAYRTYHDLGRMAAAMTGDYVFARSGLRLTREGSDKVAGYACTVWRVEEPDTAPEDAKHACITADGVPLRLIEGSGAEATTQYEATRVTYAPEDPARFRVPEDYRPLEAPGLPRRR